MSGELVTNLLLPARASHRRWASPAVRRNAAAGFFMSALWVIRREGVRFRPACASRQHPTWGVQMTPHGPPVPLREDLLYRAPSGRRCQWMAQQSSLTVLEEMQAARREAA